MAWNGKSADMPQIANAMIRHANKVNQLQVLESMHIDLLQHVNQAARFPTPQHGLHQLAEYFQLPQSTEVRHGLEALGLFQEYSSSADSAIRNKIKTKLLNYSRLDLAALIGIVHKVRALSQN